EVAIARGRRRAGIEARRTESAAGTRPTESTAATRAGSTEPAAAGSARTRSAEAAAGPRPAGTAILARARFAAGERPAVEHLAVESLDRVFRMGAVLELDKSEPTRTPGLTVYGQDDLRRRRHCTEIGAQVGFSGAVREIANEQADGQSTLS